MPKKIRELIKELKKAGFVDRGEKGSHRNFVHEDLAETLTIADKAGDDAKRYQEVAVEKAIEEALK